MFNENIYYVDSRTADTNTVVSLAGITYPNPDYFMNRISSTIFVFEYILSGKGTVICGNTQYSVTSGDVYILKEGENHLYYSDKSDPMKKIWFNVSGKIISHLLSDYRLGNVNVIENYGCSADFFEIRKNLLACRAVGKNHNNDIDLLFHKLICNLSQHFYKIHSASSEADILKTYIDSHVSEKINLQKLSSLIFCSPSKTINIFKSAFNQTPYDYLLEKKIQTASMLLRNTSMKITDICNEIGFSDSHYFSRLFKQKTGASPMEYKKTKK